MRNLSREIHENALNKAAEYKKSEAALMSAIQQVDEFRVYLEFGYGSLFEYVTQALGLSESSAYNFITVSRKAMELPQIKKEIELGNLTVSKVRKVIPVLTVENQDEWLQKAMMLPQRVLEVEVAKVAPESVRAERVRVVTETVRELRINISAELLEKLKRVQDIEKVDSLEKALECLVDFHLEKKDPVKKAERLIDSVKTPVLRQVGPEWRSCVRVNARYYVRARDGGRCTFVDSNGKRCENSRYVEIHHVKPRSEGGADRVDNLVTLCSAHHRLTHFRNRAAATVRSLGAIQFGGLSERLKCPPEHSLLPSISVIMLES